MENRGFYCWVHTSFSQNDASNICYEMILVAFDDMVDIELETMMNDISLTHDDFDVLFKSFT